MSISYMRHATLALAGKHRTDNHNGVGYNDSITAVGKNALRSNFTKTVAGL